MKFVIKEKTMSLSHVCLAVDNSAIFYGERSMALARSLGFARIPDDRR
ncbi:hypothetical protein Q6A51_12635 [Pseudomonas sp. KFB-139]|uniref:Uncharacterized protein n=1 Tax=Pseudomonas serbiensis TaxID=3064350 RepID=A0ABT9CR69_9PSED|nr:hypothetical protein [Pseudomonas sp. KFB-138]MDO7927634.1 hypothetical protein [Pseudomonas sp. KFB-138]